MKLKKYYYLVSMLILPGLGFASGSTLESNSSAVVSISTNQTKYVGVISAISGGKITNPNADPIVSTGVCWSKNPLPTVNDSKQVRTGSSDSFSCAINNLMPRTAYYVRAYVETSSGVIYGAQRTFATDSVKLGMFINGGNLFYVLKPGDPGYVEGEFHGLVGSKRIGTATVAWNNAIDTLIGALDSAVTTGKINTQKIVNVLGAGIYPAKLCSDYVSAGYDDWYLPSSHELLLMANANLVTGPNWTSTEISKTQAYFVQTKRVRTANKTQKYYLYAVRSF